MVIVFSSTLIFAMSSRTSFARSPAEPSSTAAIRTARPSSELTATRLTELDLPLDWIKQHELLAS
jgi:hypothetical protein